MTRVAYTAYLKVQVEIETEDGSGPPYYEPPYDFLAVREAEVLSVVKGEHYRQARSMIAVDLTDDFDPDGLMESEVISAGAIYEPGEKQPHEEDFEPWPDDPEKPTLEFK